MSAVLESIQEAVAGAAERVGPAVVGLGRGGRAAPASSSRPAGC